MGRAFFGIVTWVVFGGASGCARGNPLYGAQGGGTEAQGTSTSTSTSTSTGDQGRDVGTTRVGSEESIGPTGGSTGDTDATSTGEDVCACEAAEPCADLDMGAAFNALGVNCPSVPVQRVSILGGKGAIERLAQVGETNAYQPTQGSSFLVLGTGPVAQLNMSMDCADIMGVGFGPPYEFPVLPKPIAATDVSGNCLDDATLVGTGDCSNTLDAAFGDDARDYAEVRWTMVAPPGATAIEIDYALLTSEVPDFAGDPFNDMLLIWLESSAWTGNIALDTLGNPVSVSGVTFDYTGADEALAGTCMAGHAGTQWLTGTGPVREGEPLTIVVAVWDGADVRYDSYALIDGFRWVCDACP